MKCKLKNVPQQKCHLFCFIRLAWSFKDKDNHTIKLTQGFYPDGAMDSMFNPDSPSQHYEHGYHEGSSGFYYTLKVLSMYPHSRTSCSQSYTNLCAAYTIIDN